MTLLFLEGLVAHIIGPDNAMSCHRTRYDRHDTCVEREEHIKKATSIYNQGHSTAVNTQEKRFRTTNNDTILYSIWIGMLKYALHRMGEGEIHVWPRLVHSSQDRGAWTVNSPASWAGQQCDENVYVVYVRVQGRSSHHCRKENETIPEIICS